MVRTLYRWELFWKRLLDQTTPGERLVLVRSATAMAALDNEAADYFAIGGGWGAPYITGVRLIGEHSCGGGPASSFNIYFYQTVQAISQDTHRSVHEPAVR